MTHQPQQQGQPVSTLDTALRAGLPLGQLALVDQLQQHGIAIQVTNNGFRMEVVRGTLRIEVEASTFYQTWLGLTEKLLDALK